MPSENLVAEITKHILASTISTHVKCDVCYLLGKLVSCELALWECVKLTGADTSGGVPTEPYLAEYAIEEVRRLRTESEEDHE